MPSSWTIRLKIYNLYFPLDWTQFRTRGLYLWGCSARAACEGAISLLVADAASRDRGAGPTNVYSALTIPWRFFQSLTRLDSASCDPERTYRSRRWSVGCQWGSPSFCQGRHRSKRFGNKSSRKFQPLLGDVAAPLQSPPDLWLCLRPISGSHSSSPCGQWASEARRHHPVGWVMVRFLWWLRLGFLP